MNTKQTPDEKKMPVSLSRLIFKTTLFVAVTTLVILGAGSTYLTFRETYRQATEGLTNSSRLAASTVSTYMNGVLRSIDTLAPYLSSDLSEMDRKRLIQNTMLKNQEIYLEINLLNPHGESEFSSRLTQSPPESAESMMRVFKRAKAQQEQKLGDMFFSDTYSEPCLYVATPIFWRRELKAMLLTLVSVRTVWDMFDEGSPTRLTYGETGDAYLLDAEHRLIAHPRASQTLENRAAGWLPSGVAQPNRGLMRYTNDTGAMVYGTASVVPELNWMVVAEITAWELLWSSATTLLLLSVIVLGALLLSVLMSRRYSTAITHDFDELQQVSRKLAEGDLEVRAQTGSNIAEIRELSRRFNQMGEQLSRTIERLKLADRLAALGKLSAVVAHEIRNPLHCMKSFAQSFQLKAGALEARHIEYYANLLPKEIDRLDCLVNNLLDFTKQYVIEKEIIDIPVFLNSLYMQSQFKIEEANVEMHIEVAPEVQTLYADSNKLRQVFINLISNAIEALKHQGQGRIYLHAQQVQQKQLSYIEFTISDDGPGVPESIRDTIFDPFVKGRPGKGSGLGMAIAKRIVEEHEGQIVLERTSSEGTVFSVCLPNLTDGDGNDEDSSRSKKQRSGD